MKKLNLIGQIFGRLTVLKIHSHGHSTKWECICECGETVTVSTSHLLSGHTVSCGCKSKENREARNYKHGCCKAYRRLTQIYYAMLGRCYDTNRNGYDNYGGRGIKVCQEWKGNINAFVSWSLTNGYDNTKSIDRIDNNKGYSPDNCRWVSQAIQARNRRSNVTITCFGKTQTITDWAHEYHISRMTLAYRIKRGWAPEKALLTHTRSEGRDIKWN